MSTPAVGSRWIDTGVSNVPNSVNAKANPNYVLHRIVEVTSCVVNGCFVDTVGRWQQQLPSGEWETVAERKGSADVSTFGRRYRPLEES